MRYAFSKLAVLLLFAFLLWTPFVLAQTLEETTPEANPADVESADTIIAALYDVISGPAGEERDWDRFRSLMLPSAHLIPVWTDQNGEGQSRAMTVEDYIGQAGPQLIQNGFFEVEAARTSERFGNLIHAFSTYNSFRTAEDTEPFMRGINSIQVLFQGGRWWIANIVWQSQQANLPIPAEYEAREQ